MRILLYGRSNVWMLIRTWTTSNTATSTTEGSRSISSFNNHTQGDGRVRDFTNNKVKKNSAPLSSPPFPVSHPLISMCFDLIQLGGMAELCRLSTGSSGAKLAKAICYILTSKIKHFMQWPEWRSQRDTGASPCMPPVVAGN